MRDISSYRVSKLLGSKSVRFAVVTFFALAIAVAPFAQHLYTDPPLYSYFGEDSTIHQGVEFVDEHGGSSILNIVVSAPSEKGLTSEDLLSRAEKLQYRLEELESVGTVLSFPVLLRQASDGFLTSLIPESLLVDLMDLLGYDQQLSRFLAQDGDYGLFIIRVKEEVAQGRHQEILSSIEALIQNYGFRVHLTGGIFALQTRMGSLIEESIIESLFLSIPLFLGAAYLVSRSLLVAFVIVACIATVPALILGISGLFSVPLDLVTVPAATLGTALGVDEMFHLAQEYRLRRYRRETWVEVAGDLATPILSSAAVLAAGFGVLFISNFPPSQRFGSLIVGGIVAAAFAAVVAFPLTISLVERLTKHFSPHRD